MLRSVLAVCLLLLMSLARAETAVPVRVATTTLQPLVEVVPVSGSVSTARVATLSAEVEGRVSGLPVEEGQRIEKGALLMTLDDELVQRDLLVLVLLRHRNLFRSMEHFEPWIEHFG